MKTKTKQIVRVYDIHVIMSNWVTGLEYQQIFRKPLYLEINTGTRKDMYSQIDYHIEGLFEGEIIGFEWELTKPMSKTIKVIKDTDRCTIIKNKIVSVLTDDDLTPKNRKRKLIEKHHKLWGHDYASTEAFYHLMGGSDFYTPMVIKVNGDTYWYVRNNDTKAYLYICDKELKDTKLNIDFSKGHGCGFLTKKPSKRTQIILNKVYQLNNK